MITQREYKVLDKGFVRVIDVMGDDSAIVDAARISYNRGAGDGIRDKALLRYLMRHKHTSPFEMCEIKLGFKMPMVIGEQVLRHRTANVNKFSGRYSEFIDEFYIPRVCDVAAQSEENKQGRGKVFDESSAVEVIQMIEKSCSEAYRMYTQLLGKGVSRELARMVLPGNIYTQFYWKIDLHNLLNFLHLRTHSTAQYEIREYANVIEKIVAEWVPITYEAFVNYRKEAVMVSKQVKKCLSRNESIPESLGQTERREFEEIWGKI
jgi:thymidylate synthase (FAD)